MLNNKSNRRNRVIAWGMLFILLTSITMKAVHFHPFDNRCCMVYVQHAKVVVANSDYCPICQFSLSPSEAATTFHLIFIALFFGLYYGIVSAQRFTRQYAFHLLRAPPVRLL